MDQAAARASDIAVLAFEDGLGRRYRVQTGGDRDVHLEVLCFRPELTDIPSFEFALRERVGRLSTFQHAYYARIRRVDRLNGGTLALFSECTPGVRLAELLTETERRGLVLDINTALCVLRQLAPAVALLHQSAHVANGALGPERLILTPQARLVIVEFAVGGALEQLHYSRERYWQDLRVALPPSAGLPRFDEYADVAQLGIVGLSLVLGRLVRADEYPGAVEDLVASATARSVNGDSEPITASLRSWLRRALQLDVRASFRSPMEAQGALEELVASDDTYTADINALTTFLDRYHESTGNKAGAQEQPSARASEAKPDVPAPTLLQPILYDAPPQLPVPPVTPAEIHQSVIASEIKLSVADSEARRATTPTDLLMASAEAIEWVPEEPAAEHHTPVAPPMETAARRQKAPSKKRTMNRGTWVAGGLVLAVVAAALFAGQRFFMPAAHPISTGTLVVNTNPPGAQITVDEVARGQTPVNLSLEPGRHNVVVRGDGDPRTVVVTIVAGATSSQYLDLPKAAATTGMLQIWTEPSGARVTVDGQVKGNTPLTVTELASGEHSVTLENDQGSVNHKVVVVPGIPATLVVPLGAPQGAVASGWLSVSAPMEMQIYEQGRLLGTSGIDRIMLPTGKHEIEIANEALGFSMSRTIQVTPGKVSPIAVVLPKGVVSLNALPWATVSIDGESVGETPIGNLSVAIGAHEVVFRNPQFGEQRRVINVTLNGPVRLSIDLSKK